MLLAGVNPKVVSEALGHSSVGFTLDTYSHVLPTIQRTAMSNWTNCCARQCPTVSLSATLGDFTRENWQGRQDSNPRPAVLEFENEDDSP